jgi:D-glycero-D-manno-heptose 1,7-bisphosphate phosphatase
MPNTVSAVFLDRDGVIIQNRPDYIRAWDDVEFLPGALEALRALREHKFNVFIITNQSVVGRGLIPLELAREINERIIETIKAHGGHITGAYICPHTPSQACDCRKPRPGLILRASQDHKLKLADSILIGDAITDLQAGHDAGIVRLALVRTGRGIQQEKLLDRLEFEPDIYDDLSEALNDML